MKVEVTMEGTGDQRTVLFRLRGIKADVTREDVEFQIFRDTPHFRYLAHGAWGDDETWIRPDEVSGKRDPLEARFNHLCADAIEGEGLLQVTVRLSGGATHQAEVVTGWGPLAGTPGDTGGGRMPWILVTAILLVASAAGVGWFQFIQPALNTAQTPLDQREIAKRIIDAHPTPSAAFDAAERLSREHHYDAAFLVYRYAGQRGEGRASLVIAHMYDPRTYDPNTTPLTKANPEQAAIWYDQVTRQTASGSAIHQQALDALRYLDPPTAPNGG